MGPENIKDFNGNFEKSTEISTKKSNEKSTTFIDNNGNILLNKKRKFVGSSIRGRIKRESEPLPMKLRALPRSFWQQPNEPTRQSPGEMCPELPIGKEENNCQTIPKPPQESGPEITTPANTELLFSLFQVVDSKKSLIRRGRPRKPASLQVGMKDADPCLVSTVNEPPLGVVNKGRDNGHNGGYSNLLAELVVRL